MKKRQAFVSNSSSTSYVGIGFEVPDGFKRILPEEVLGSEIWYEDVAEYMGNLGLGLGFSVDFSWENLPDEPITIFAPIGFDDGMVELDRIDFGKLVTKVTPFRDKLAPGAKIGLVYGEMEYY